MEVFNNHSKMETANSTNPNPTEELVPEGFDLIALANRLGELADCATQGPKAILHNFTLRVPADPYHDADLVLSTAADLIRAMAIQIRENKVHL
jgi:hypothetical protein